MSDDALTDEAPDEAFSLVANETRFDILQALWDADDPPTQFSELRERVGMRDSGQFNYHLDKLQPEFVRQVDEGYELTYAGSQVIGAAVSGTYTHADVTVDPIAVGDCPNCEGVIEASYDRGYMGIQCDTCEMVITDALPAPPIVAANHDPEELPRVFSRLLLTRAQAEDRGFCQLCGGPTEKSLAAERKAFDRAAIADHLAVRSTCQTCGSGSYQFVGWTVIDHPAVVSFLYDHGIDVRKTPIWDLYTRWMADPHASVTSEDPLRIETTIELDDERLTLTQNGDLEVVAHERTAI